MRVSPRGAQRNEVVDLVEAERVERNIRARLRLGVDTQKLKLLVRNDELPAKSYAQSAYPLLE